jgi:hypothetical protein
MKSIGDLLSDRKSEKRLYTCGGASILSLDIQENSRESEQEFQED